MRVYRVMLQAASAHSRPGSPHCRRGPAQAASPRDRWPRHTAARRRPGARAAGEPAGGW